MIFMNSLSPSFLLKEKETFFHFCDTHIDACPGLPTDVSVIVAGIFNMRDKHNASGQSLTCAS